MKYHTGMDLEGNATLSFRDGDLMVYVVFYDAEVIVAVSRKGAAPSSRSFGGTIEGVLEAMQFVYDQRWDSSTAVPKDRETGRKAGLAEAAKLIRWRISSLEMMHNPNPKPHEMKVTAKPGTIEVLREALDLVEGRLTVTEAEAKEFGKSVVMDTPRGAAPQKMAEAPLLIAYTNHKGERRLRRIQPLRIYFGATPWHPAPQWLLRGVDLDKHAERDFAMAGFAALFPDPTVIPSVLGGTPPPCPTCGSIMSSDGRCLNADGGGHEGLRAD